MLSMLEFAKEMAKGAGEILREGYHKDIKINAKANRELVTEIDFQVEDFLRKAIAERFPEHFILAEEEGGSISEEGFTWVIDPLDGTNNYAHRFPFFCVSIGLLERGKPVLGVVYEPLRDEMFASDGGLSFLNGRQIKVENRKDIDDSIFATGFPYNIRDGKKDNLANFTKFCTHSRGIRRAGSAAIDLCYVAAGRLDGYWENTLKPWDIAAGYVIVKGAGGICTDYQGNDWQPGQDQIVAGNPELHKNMLDLLNTPLEER